MNSMLIKYKKIIRRIVMIIFISTCIMLYCNRSDIIKGVMERNMTEFDKRFVVLLWHEHGFFERMEEKGFLDGRENMIDVDRLVEEINANCTEEEIEIYNKILFGGFSVDEYLENHTYEDLFLLITKLDVMWPVELRKVVKDGNIEYEEKRFSFWNLMYIGTYL